MYRLVSVNTLLSVMVFWMLCGCSSGGSALTPDTQEGDQNPGLVTTAQGHHILGIFSFRFDAATQKLTAVPNREVMAHYNVTPYLLPPYCDDCFELEILTFFPDLKELIARIKVKNPYPFTGYDIRSILMHNQPGWDILNNYGYTSLFDDGGDIEINPFIYLKEEIEPEQHADNKEVWVEYPDNPDFAGAKIVIEASWPEHCQDVYKLRKEYGNIVIDFNGSMVHAEVEAYDWQDDILSITMDASPIAAGIVEFAKDPVISNLWTADFFAPGASGAVPPGEYKLLVTASSDTPIKTYTYIPVFLNPAPMPVDVTPGNLAFGTYSMVVWDDHRLVCRRSRYGIDIFDTTVQGLPMWAGCAQLQPTPGGSFSDLEVVGDIACVSQTSWCVHFVDISDIYAPKIIGAIPFNEGTLHCVRALEAGGDYLYAANTSGEELHLNFKITVIDPNASPSPQVVGELKTAREAVDLAVHGGYMYYTHNKKIFVVDLADPVNPLLVGEVILPAEPYSYKCEKLLASGNYLFGLLTAYGGDAIVAWDISTPGQPVVAGFAELPGEMKDLSAFGNDILITCSDVYVHVVNVGPTGELNYTGAVTTEGDTLYIASSPEHVYVTESAPAGISTYNPTSPEMPVKIGKIPKLTNPSYIELEGEYAYVIDDTSRDTFRVLDIAPPERTNIIASIVVGSYLKRARDMDIGGGVACILMDNNVTDSIYLTVISIANPEEPLLAADVEVNLDWDPERIFIGNGYAYASAEEGIVIFDINPPEAAHVYDVFETPDTVNILGYHNGRLFCHSWELGLLMYDVSNPEVPQLLGVMPYPQPIRAFDAVQNYAYAAGFDKVVVISIANPEAMVVVDETSFNHWPRSFSLMGGFLFAPANENGIWIATRFPPGTIEPAFYLELPSNFYSKAEEVACQDGYMFVSVHGSSVNQLLIYKWW